MSNNQMVTGISGHNCTIIGWFSTIFNPISSNFQFSPWDNPFPPLTSWSFVGSTRKRRFELPFYGGAVESGPEVRCARRLKFAGLAHGDALEKMEQKDRYDYDMTMIYLELMVNQLLFIGINGKAIVIHWN